MSKRRKSDRPRPGPVRCDVCGRIIPEGATSRYLFVAPSALPWLYGHAACVDGVVAHQVEAHGGTYLGDVGA